MSAEAGPRLLGGRYELGETLGYGGMAEVYSGRDVRLGREVAVKVLRADLARDPVFHSRFQREAQSAAALNHPAVVAVYDTGEDDAAEAAAVPYIVMEYVRGRTLREVLHEDGPLLPQRALEIVADVCTALDYSHRSGIVHRDIKPGNVMLDDSGAVKVMDFGIARAVATASSTMTQTASVVGTAQYLSPEQARGANVDSRSDLYSTGCLLYELLTGAPPFTGDSPVAVAYQHVREEAPLPSSHDPQLSPDVDAVVMKAMAKNPENRYQDASAMREDLLRAAAGQPVMAEPVLLDDRTQVFSAPLAAAPIAEVRREEPGEDERDKRRGLIFSLVALAVLALVAAGAFFAQRQFADSEPEVVQVPVPLLVGLEEDAAIAGVLDANFVVGEVDRAFSNDVAEGVVMEQNPESGILREEGSVVDFVVSQGAEQVAVPTLVGRSEQQARSALQEAGLSVASVQRRNANARAGQVVGSDPSAGVEVDRGSAVTLVVATGNVELVDVTGRSASAARSALRDRGFSVDVVETETSEAAEGTVVDQSPGAGVVRRGITVTLVVATAPPPPPPPPPSPAPAPPSPTPAPAPSPPAPPSPSPPSPSPSPPSPTTPPPTDEESDA